MLPASLQTPEAIVRLCLQIEYPREEIEQMLRDKFAMSAERSAALVTEAEAASQD